MTAAEPDPHFRDQLAGCGEKCRIYGLRMDGNHQVSHARDCPKRAAALAQHVPPAAHPTTEGINP